MDADDLNHAIAMSIVERPVGGEPMRVEVNGYALTVWRTSRRSWHVEAVAGDETRVIVSDDALSLYDAVMALLE